MHEDLERVLYTAQQLDQITDQIAAALRRDYQGKEVVFVCLLKGSFVFFADLVRKAGLDAEVDFMAVSSYGSSSVSSGNVTVKKDVSADIRGKHVIIVEDILDTGNTLSYITSYMQRFSPASVKICTLFDKPSRRTQPIVPDYYGTVIEDWFIVGYGLDYNEQYRTLPYVGILKPGIYAHD